MRYFFTIILCFVAVNIFGQELKKTQFQFSVGTAITIPYKITIEIWPEVEGHPGTDYGSNFGFFSEFIFQFNIDDKISINPGLNFIYSKLKINDKIGFVESEGNISSSCLQFPVLLKYHLSEKLPISISAGPYLGLLLSANEKGTLTIDTEITGSADPIIYLLEPGLEYNNNIKKDYTLIDLGLSIQIDYETRINNKLAGVIITRFNYGLMDVMSNEIVNKNTANDWKNYSLMIGFGLGI